jgi:HEAT repeats/Putative zinc-finger
MNGMESGKVSGNDSGPAAAECGWAQAQISLLLYGELSFDEEEKVESHIDACEACRAALDRQTQLHAAFDQVSIDPPASLLNQCRNGLWSRLDDEPAPQPALSNPPYLTSVDRHPETDPHHHTWWGHVLWDHLVDALLLRPVPGVAGRWLRPIGAFALLAIGFLGARMAPGLMPNLLPGAGALAEMSLTQPAASHVRYVEPGAGGQVQIILDETRQRIISGHLDDRNIRSLLLTAAKDPSDPGLRTETLDILSNIAQNNATQASDIRDVLVFALEHDQNAGVRLKAMEGLKPLAHDPRVRTALAAALLSDENPGVRTQAIDVLSSGSNAMNRTIVGTLQELMMREDNAYVRDRCRLVLESLKASPETY